MGVKKSAIIYTGIGAFGVALFTAGGVTNKFWLMLLGRFFFGMGNEMSSIVCVDYCIYTHFNRSSVNLFFSMTDSLSYLGTVAVFQLSPYLLSTFSITRTPLQSLNLILILYSFVYLLAGSLIIWVTFIKPSADESSRGSSREISLLNRLTIQDVIKFPASFWLLCLVFYMYWNAFTTFETFSQGLLTSDIFKLDLEEASNVLTTMNAFKITLSIPLSVLVDRCGRNIVFLSVSIILSVVAYTLLILKVQPYICLTLLGASYSFIGSSIWAMFAFPISERLRGSCFGIVSAVTGLSQTVSPVIVGVLIDRYGYLAAICFFLSNAFGAGCLLIVTWIIDSKSEGLFYMTSKQRVERDAIRRAESIECLSPVDWYVEPEED